MSKTFVTKVEILDGQMSVLIPPGLFESLNLKDGQFLIWEVDNDVIVIKKKVEINKNVE
jgi:antitoxin component of MazEF toxin-antitoxin module